MTTSALPGTDSHGPAAPPAKGKAPRNRAKDISPVEPYRLAFADAKREGETWRRHWAEIEEYQFPRRGRWLRGEGKPVVDTAPYSDKLLNNTSLMCRRIVASGLQNGLVPSSQEWYGIQPSDEQLRDNARVTWFLSRLVKKGMEVLRGTTFYSECNGMFEDADAFGSSAMLMEDDSETILSFLRLPVGSFWPVAGRNGRIGKLFRRYAMSAENLLEEFGEDALSKDILDQLENGRFLERSIVIQCIQPADPEDRRKPEWARYESVYFLEKKPDGGDRFLARRYYRVKPFVVFRWSTDDDVAYGARCPGMDTLGDCKQLQSMERKKLKAVDVSTDPALLAPQSLFGHLNRRPGTVTWTQGDQADQVKPLLSVNYPIQYITQDIKETEQRIARGHYNDMFLSMLATGKTMTAEEARQRAEERTMVLGPLIERFQFDLLDDLLNRLNDAIMFNQLLPPPPEELGNQIKYTYSGPLALIQRMNELGNIERWLTMAANVAQIKQSQSALDRIDEDEIIEIAAEIMGIDPALIVSYEDAEKARAARAEQVQQAAAGQQAMDMAKGAETLSRAEVGGRNALEAMLGGLGGQGGGQGL